MANHQDKPLYPTLPPLDRGNRLVFVGRDPLSSTTRRRIYEYVTQEPGTHLRAIARGVKLDTNHTKYHLTYLEQHGLVNSERVHGYWTFFPKDGALPEGLSDLSSCEKAQLFLVRKEVPKRVVLKLLEENEANHKVLQEAAGVSASTLYYHLRRMAEKEVVVSRKDGPARLWRLHSPELTRRLLGVVDHGVQADPELETTENPQEEKPVHTTHEHGEINEEERWVAPIRVE